MRITDKSAAQLETMWLEACGSWRTVEEELRAARAEINWLQLQMTRIAYALGYSADDRAHVVELAHELLAAREFAPETPRARTDNEDTKDKS